MPLAAAPDALTVPTWLGALATVGLFIGAGFTVYYARHAFLKQSAEFDDQRETNKKLAAAAELQVDELRESLAERKRQAVERRSAQASRVFAWQERRPALESTDPGPAETSGLIFAHVRNASDQPVYDLQFRWLFKERARPFKTTQTEAPLGPGAARKIEFRGHPDIGLDQFSVAVCFRDAAGVTWLRRPNGYLEELAAD